MSAVLMTTAMALAVLGAGTGPRGVVVDEAPDEAEPGTVETQSDAYRLRLGGLVEGALGRDQWGNAVGLPRVRLKAEGLVSMQLEVGLVAEVDVSPWSSVNLKEDGPGPARDLYARMALGNKKLLDLGEARLGHFAVPLAQEQQIPQQDMLFATGTLGREAWLPGRELSAAYEIGGYRYGVPLRGTFSLASGVTSPMGADWFTQRQEPHAGADENAAAGVPLTSGTTYRAVANPGLAARVEGRPLYRWTRKPGLKVGAGALIRPLARGADARGAAVLDAELEWSLVVARVGVMAVDTQRGPLMDSAAFYVESALQVLPDFADVRARYEAAWGPSGMEAQRVSVGTALFYIDGAPPTILSHALPLPVGPSFGRAFTVLWLRTYDLGRYSRARGAEVPGGGLDAAPWLLGEARYWASGDVDQLVLRVAF